MTFNIGGNYSKNDMSGYLTKSEGDVLFVNERGDSMTSTLNMSGNKIVNLANPTTSSEASNKKYVDETINIKIKELDQRIDQRINIQASVINQLVEVRSGQNNELNIFQGTIPENRIINIKGFILHEYWRVNSGSYIEKKFFLKFPNRFEYPGIQPPHGYKTEFVLIYITHDPSKPTLEVIPKFKLTDKNIKNLQN